MTLTLPISLYCGRKSWPHWLTQCACSDHPILSQRANCQRVPSFRPPPHAWSHSDGAHHLGEGTACWRRRCQDLRNDASIRWGSTGQEPHLIHHKARQQAPLLQLLQRVCQSRAGHELLRRDVQQLQAWPLLAQLLRKQTYVSLCTPAVSLYCRGRSTGRREAICH